MSVRVQMFKKSSRGSVAKALAFHSVKLGSILTVTHVSIGDVRTCTSKHCSCAPK